MELYARGARSPSTPSAYPLDDETCAAAPRIGAHYHVPVPGEVTRKGFLRQSAAVALAAGGVYELVDVLAPAPARAGGKAVAAPAEQHLLRNVRHVTENGIVVMVPPLHHQLVTARLRVGRTKAALRDARGELEQALREVDRRFAPTPSGLGVVVGWGLPYFRRYVPSQWARHAPRNLATRGPVLLDATRFPSDPPHTVMERNDVILQFRSDRLDHIAAASKLILDRVSGMLELTSIRRGFVGGNEGGLGLPKQMALKAGIPAADLIPDAAPLFLGFTSSQRSALGPDRIANLETLPGLTDQWPGGYFRQGTTMHVSHLYLDLENWYTNFSFTDRVWATFTPNLDAPDGTMTVPEGAEDVATMNAIQADVSLHGFTGHSAAMQPETRLPADTRDNYGTVYPAGTALIQRPDFDTLDSPFAWTSQPFRDRWSEHPSAGVHFVAYAATTNTFNRARLAMDGRYTDGTVLPTDPTAPSRQFNAVLETTHRQNFLVPPRRHRSFPLSEL